MLISQRVATRVEDHVVLEAAGELLLKGLSRPIADYNVVDAKPAAA